MKPEMIFAIIVAVLAAVGGLLFAPGRELALVDIVLVKMVSVAVFLAFTSGLLFTLRGTKYDPLTEIFDQDKNAAAIFTGLLLVALALVLGK